MNRKWNNQNVCYDNPLQKIKALGFFLRQNKKAKREQVLNKKCGL